MKRPGADENIKKLLHGQVIDDAEGDLEIHIFARADLGKIDGILARELGQAFFPENLDLEGIALGIGFELGLEIGHGRDDFAVHLDDDITGEDAALLGRGAGFHFMNENALGQLGLGSGGNGRAGDAQAGLAMERRRGTIPIGGSGAAGSLGRGIGIIGTEDRKSDE